MALQRWGDADMDGLLAEMTDWAAGNPLEQRAAAAALCEPRLLREPEHAAAVLRILDGITASIPQVTDRKSDAFKTLRQGLGYCWSVAVAALPDDGQAADGKMARQCRPRHSLDHAREFEEESAGQDGRHVGGPLARVGQRPAVTGRRNLSFDRRSGIMRIRCTQSTEGDRPRCKCCS